MKTPHHLLRLLLLPFFLVALVALVLIYTTQSQLNQQFELTQQAQYADLQVLHNASQFAADLGQIQQRMEQAFSGAPMPARTRRSANSAMLATARSPDRSRLTRSKSNS